MVNTPAVTDNPVTTIICPFGGTISPTVSANLKANTFKVLSKAELVGPPPAEVSNCVSSAPCVTIASVKGESTVLTKDGSGVILTTSVITGSTGHLFTITESQTVLKG